MVYHTENPVLIPQLFYFIIIAPHKNVDLITREGGGLEEVKKLRNVLISEN